MENSKLNSVFVEQFEGKNGPVKNQFIITTPTGVYFQSYNSIIALRKNGKIYLDRDEWDFSVTTGKYRNIFLCEKKKETEKKIQSGVYELVNLND